MLGSLITLWWHIYYSIWYYLWLWWHSDDILMTLMILWWLVSLMATWRLLDDHLMNICWLSDDNLSLIIFCWLSDTSLMTLWWVHSTYLTKSWFYVTLTDDSLMKLMIMMILWWLSLMTLYHSRFLMVWKASKVKILKEKSILLLIGLGSILPIIIPLSTLIFEKGTLVSTCLDLGIEEKTTLFTLSINIIFGILVFVVGLFCDIKMYNFTKETNEKTNKKHNSTNLVPWKSVSSPGGVL